MSRSKTAITPDTKVADLLRDYPTLEATLLQFSPAFAALKNPVLRKTVARVTSLQQAAKVGNVPVVEMVNVLRKEIGMAELGESFCPDGEENPVPVSLETPKTPVTLTLDVRPIIEEGDHPKEIVLTQADKLLPGECMELISPFPPAPLITLLQQKGFRVTMLPPQEGLVRTLVER
ncbi:MAG: DUF1858 domain-containing protein [Proteiniphilum sp.]|nr:DUF1858 domain-containing protein [Proteiniphilum sp.]